MIDEFRRGAALGAERLPGRVRRVGFEAGEAALFDDRDGAASRDAEPAKGVDPLHPVVIGHGNPPCGKVLGVQNPRSVAKVAASARARRNGPAGNNDNASIAAAA